MRAEENFSSSFISFNLFFLLFFLNLSQTLFCAGLFKLQDKQSPLGEILRGQLKIIDYTKLFLAVLIKPTSENRWYSLHGLRAVFRGVERTFTWQP